MTEKVKKPSNSECDTPSSEPFIIKMKSVPDKTQVTKHYADFLVF
jgi:hypothetical protein